MANVSQTNKFGNNPGTPTTTPSPTNYGQPTIVLTDGDGKVIKGLTVDANGRASYSTLLTAGDIGQKTVVAQFTGDPVYAHGTIDKFSVQIPDQLGLNNSKAQIGTVNQIVAGGGIYISAPNGQGVVTVSTEPLNLDHFKGDVYDISWSEIVYDYDSSYKPIYDSKPYGIPGQFTAVGSGGAILRSRDGHNWVQMYPYTTATLYAVASEINPIINENHLEMLAVGAGGQAAAGVLGGTTDSLENVGQLTDQDGLILDDFYGVGIFVNDAQVVSDYQFTGGLTTEAQTSVYGATTATGVPLVDDTGAITTFQVYSHYKINNVQLRRTNGVPTTEFSHSTNAHLILDINMWVEDIRITPGTAITGQYPILLKDNNAIITLYNTHGPLTTQNDINSFFDSILGYSNLTQNWPASATNSGITVNYFTPYVKGYIRDVQPGSGYPNNAWIPLLSGYPVSGGSSGWNATTYSDTKVSVDLGMASDFPMGQFELKIDVKRVHTLGWVDYSYTAIVTIGA